MKTLLFILVLFIISCQDNNKVFITESIDMLKSQRLINLPDTYKVGDTVWSSGFSYLTPALKIIKEK